MKRETSITLHENKMLRESYYDIHHKSGLRICFIPKELSVTYALFATRYGSIDNVFRLVGEESFTKVPEGIAHFLEHKMFEAEDGTDTFERFAKVGASANAFTSSAGRVRVGMISPYTQRSM
jgi:predicted Zn-dependent peptidase